MAEAILRAVGGNRFKAQSAGLVPAAAPDPRVLDFLVRRHIPTRGLRSQSVFALLRAGTALDYVITLCPRAAAEMPRNWPGNPVLADWHLETLPYAPSSATLAGDDAIRDTFWTLMRRIKIFTSLPHGAAPRRKIESRLHALALWQ